MKKYKEKEKKDKTLIWALEELMLIFVVATVSIVLYDIYINVDIEPKQEYSATKITKETNIGETKDVSGMLENVSESVVRNIKNCNK